MPALIPTPLEKKRCTGCGHGVADGADFKRRGNGWRSRCTDCESLAALQRQRQKRGWAEGEVAAPPTSNFGRLAGETVIARNRRLAALYRENAARDRDLAPHADNPYEHARMLRSADTWDRLAADADIGRFSDHGTGEQLSSEVT